MATKVFDRETLLDLLVNFVPLGIILFFIVAFGVYAPFGFDPLAKGVQYFLLLMPFVSLAILTYLSAKAIAGSEKRETVYLPGQATVEGAEPAEERVEDHEGVQAEPQDLEEA